MHELILRPEMLLPLYYNVMRIRLVEEEIARRYPEDQMKCPVHLSIGQEAAAVGLCAKLRTTDVLLSTHRCHAHYLAKGGDMTRMVAELYGKATGCAKGLAGSMHLVDPSVGMYGASAIVCGSLPLAVGAALAFSLRKEDRVAVACFGDAAVEPGVFHECLNFAALQQLPVIFFCENNDYSTMTPRHQRQFVPIAERAAGYGMPGVRVDGNDVLQVLRVCDEAAFRARVGEGPTLIEAVTYRTREHVEHNTGIMQRPENEKRFWAARDPVPRFREELLSYGVSPDALAVIDADVCREVTDAFFAAEAAPFLASTELAPLVAMSLPSEKPPASFPRNPLSMTEAIAQATVQAMEDDPNAFVMGLHVTDANGVFGTTTAAFQRFGGARVLETPISEASLTSIAAGAAMMGMRPLHVHARNDFLLLALSQLANEVTKWHFMTAGQISMPIVIRAIIGRSRGQGCQHSQSLQAVFAHFPGWCVVAPSNAYDAKGLLLAAMRSPVPVLFLEHRLCHPLVSEVSDEPYMLPFGKAAVRSSGTDVTIVAVLHMVHEAVHAARILERYGLSADVLDLRSIRPWDAEAVCASVAQTGRLIIADTGWVDFGLSAEISATVTERMFSFLKAPPVRIGLPPHPTPMAEPLETAYYPGFREIARAAFRLCGRSFPEDLSLQRPSSVDGPF